MAGFLMDEQLKIDFKEFVSQVDDLYSRYGMYSISKSFSKYLMINVTFNVDNNSKGSVSVTIYSKLIWNCKGKGMDKWEQPFTTTMDAFDVAYVEAEYNLGISEESYMAMRS